MNSKQWTGYQISTYKVGGWHGDLNPINTWRFAAGIVAGLGPAMKPTSEQPPVPEVDIIEEICYFIFRLNEVNQRYLNAKSAPGKSRKDRRKSKTFKSSRRLRDGMKHRLDKLCNNNYMQYHMDRDHFVIALAYNGKLLKGKQIEMHAYNYGVYLTLLGVDDEAKKQNDQAQTAPAC